ncbi:unnamed protein product, partial [Oncorhynchus mykiss]
SRDPWFGNHCCRAEAVFIIVNKSGCIPSSSCGRRLDDPTVTSTTGTGSSFSAGLSRLNILVAQRLAQEQAEKKKEQCSVTSNSVTTTTGGDLETKQRRKSYLTPVRDEEAEAQRKARSRHARQSRRSTQGVTLTDLQEADKTMKTAQTDEGREKTRKEEEEEAANKKRAEEGYYCLQEVSWRSRIANLQKSDLLGLTQPDGTSRPPTSSQETSGGERESDRIARERRRTRRRAQRAGETDDNEPSGEEGFGGSGRASTRYGSDLYTELSCFLTVILVSHYNISVLFPDCHYNISVLLPDCHSSESL